MSVNNDQFVSNYVNAMAPSSQRQMPVFSQMGKGMRGDSCALHLDEDGIATAIKAEYFNQMTGETSTLWEFPVIELVPKIHYEVWGGVRNVDDTYMNGYYIKYRCVLEIRGNSVELWNFQTPFAMTVPFHGSTIPVDWLIDSDESE